MCKSQSKGKKMKVTVDGVTKSGRSDEYSFDFNMATGQLDTWKGYDKEVNTEYNPHGCVIADIEITQKCEGIPQKAGEEPTPCPFCYHSNTSNGINMPFELFKEIIDKMPDCLTQVALGADSTLKANPDIWKMMQYCRDNKIIPNITCANVDDETADKLSKYCGGVAVSCYENVDVCFDSVKRLTDRGVKTNIHMMLSKETLPTVYKLIDALQKDSRLKDVAYTTFLSLKRKGRGKSYNILSQEEFDTVIRTCFAWGINIGMDSCSSYRYMKTLQKHFPDNVGQAEEYVASCESGLESTFFSADGYWYPCSFCKNELDGVHISEMESFGEFWKTGTNISNWRRKLLSTYDEETKCRKCPMYVV